LVEKLLKIILYCMVCCIATDQIFVQDDGVYEVYRCERCGNQHRIAVR